MVFMIVTLLTPFIPVNGFGVSFVSANASDNEVFYVSPDGNDEGTGTKEDPWKTLDKASQATAGQTIIFLPGTYEGILNPQNSGTEDEPIVFKAEESRTAKLVGLDSNSHHHAIKIRAKSYIEIDGFHIEPQNPEFGRWISVNSDTSFSGNNCTEDPDPGQKSSHLTISNVLMEKAFGKGAGGAGIPLVFKNASQVQFKNNTMRQFQGGDMSWFACTDHVVFEGNSISHAGHSPSAFSPLYQFKSNTYTVVRGNVYHASWGRPFEMFGDPHMLVENNVITHAYHGGMSAGPEAKLMMEDSIFRYNQVYRNFGSPINIHYQVAEADSKGTRIYNNVFDDNYTDAVNIATQVKDYMFKNNIFSNNDLDGGNRQLLMEGDSEHFQFINNAFWAAGAEGVIDNTTGTAYSVDDVQSSEWEAEHGDQFSNNINVNPSYVDAENHNYGLTSDSPLIDAGTALTTAAFGGSGDMILVEDAKYFFDGFGIEGEIGDLISVGDASNQARIVSIDYDNNLINLDRDLEPWSTGDPVSLAYSGDAPDIGVYEYGDDARASVEIDTDSFIVEQNEPINFSATVRGLTGPLTYEWRLGDGTVADGSEVTHSYDAPFINQDSAGPSGYPIFLEVTDSEGRILNATSYVEIKEPNYDEKPLVHVNFNEFGHATRGGVPNFDNEDANSWWVFYLSRPTIDLEIVDDGEGNLVGHFIADAGEAGNARYMPADWDIDKYPYLKFSYRIDPGMPIAVQLQGSSTIENARNVYLAEATDANAPSDMIVGDGEFIDDGQWHDITLDVRAIREKYPEVTRIQELIVGAPDRNDMSDGDGYYLEDFAILPDVINNTVATATALVNDSESGGQYSQDAIDALQASIDVANQVSIESADLEIIYSTVDTLKQAMEAFKAELGANPNMLSNGGFEEGTDDCAQDWSCSSYGSGSITRDSSVLHDGEWSIKMTDEDTNRGHLITQTVDAESGKRYDISGWYKTEGIEANSYVYVFFQNADGETIASEQLWIDKLGTNDWEAINLRTSIAPEGTAKVKMNFTMWATPGTVWWDQVSVLGPELPQTIADAEEVLDTADIGDGVGQYPQAAADALESAITDAEAAVGSDQETVDQAIVTLYQAIDTFYASENGVKRDALEQAIEDANAVVSEAVIGDNPGQYPLSAVLGIQSAIEDAEAVLADDSIDNTTGGQETIDQAVSALNQAVATFEAAAIAGDVDTAALSSSISDANSKVSDAEVGEEVGDYPQAAVDALETAIADAEAVLADDEADQTEVDAAVAALKQAVETFEAAVIPETSESPLTGVEVDQDDVLLEVDEKVELTVKATFEHESSSDVTEAASYSSSDQGVVTVTSNGVLQAVSAGSAQITITYKGKTTTVTVKVYSTSIKIGESVVVVPGEVFTVEGSSASIKMPEDLPAGTTITVVEAIDLENPGYEVAGDVYTVEFTFPDGTTVEGSFTLTLGYDADKYDADDVSIFYFNEETGEWEHQGGVAADGVITLEVPHFSTYGVFAEVDDDASQDADDELPDTATSTYSWILAGLILLGLGLAFTVMMRRNRIED